jgi:peptide/nickel transport system permease protein
MWGGRISLRIGIISAAIATFFGLLLGLLSGYYGGVISFIILRFMDLLLAFPGILLALFIVATLGPNLDNVMIAIGISAIPSFTRVVHGCVLSAKEDDYVKAAIVIGCKHSRIIFKHILPNITAPVIVLCTLEVGSAIFGAASLSFIGLGAQPPIPEWGSMVSRGRYNLDLAMWISTFPGLAIASVVISINIIGDVLRDALDPFVRER